MKRFLVLVIILLPLSLFVAGCDTKGGGGRSGPPIEPDQAEMDKMLKGQEQMAKEQMKGPPSGEQKPAEQKK